MGCQERHRRLLLSPVENGGARGEYSELRVGSALAGMGLEGIRVLKRVCDDAWRLGGGCERPLRRPYPSQEYAAPSENCPRIYGNPFDSM